jgi:hypothetical protein
MTNRIAFAAFVFAMGAYSSICVFVDSSRGGYCWIVRDSNYERLPFTALLISAWNSLLADSSTHPTVFVLRVLSLTAFLWPAVSVLIDTGGLSEYAHFY